MTTPSAQDYLDGAHQRTIWFVVRLLGGLLVLLYALIGFIVINDGKGAVPGELWQGASGLTTFLGGMLVTLRTQSSAPVAAPLTQFLAPATIGRVDTTPDVSAAELADDSFPSGATDAPDTP